MDDKQTSDDCASVEVESHHNYQLRFAALDYAVKCSHMDSNHKETLERAKAFLEFLKAKD